ncbi:MAG: hypothetical protein ABI432_12370, partial [Flavobacteriales bacterium]
MNTRAVMLQVTSPQATPSSNRNGAAERDDRPTVLVFRTSVNTKGQVLLLAPALAELLGGVRWSFDLEDRDRILRIEQGPSIRNEVIVLLHRMGFM